MQDVVSAIDWVAIGVLVGLFTPVSGNEEKSEADVTKKNLVLNH